MRPTTKSLAAAIAAAVAAMPLTAQWGPVATTGTPSPRVDAIMAYDLPGNRMLMLGGNWTDEFWSLQNGVWTQLQPTVKPSARARAGIAVDSLTGTILLYGGDGGSTQFALDETWQWNGATWTQFQPAITPGGLARHTMAFDIVRQTTVLFGGRYNSWVPQQQSDQTWEFRNGGWTQAAPLQIPPARVNAAMAYHPTLQQVMLFGGEDWQAQPLGDTWTYDGTTWAQLPATGPQPSGRSNAQLVPILVRNLCVLAGGRDPVTMVIQNDTWEHDGVSWREVNNVYGGIYPPRRGFAVAEDIGNARIVAFGGAIANNSLQNDTWEYGAHWQPFGSGCAGSNGTPTLTGGTRPKLGYTCTAQIDNLPAASSVALMAVGFSRQQWTFGSLPAQLTNFGMPGCRAYCSADAMSAVAANAGTAQWSWTVPSIPDFVGQPFHLQAISLDAAANPGGATVSNAATIVIGW